MYCEHCGEPTGQTGQTGQTEHPACSAALRMEPPRYCAQCRRRMVVQVTPARWTARCVEHGVLTSA
jgi:hypothetical protein